MHTPDYACKRHILDILHDSNANKASFTDQGIYDRYMTSIFMSYIGIILGSGTLDPARLTFGSGSPDQGREVPTLSSSVLVWNGGGGVAIKEAWKERNPTKNVFNFANVECRYRGGLIKHSNSD